MVAHYWNSGYTIEMVAHYWNGGYTIEMMAIEVSNGPCRDSTTCFLAGHACQHAGPCRPSEGFGPCRASPRKKIGGPAQPISPCIIRAVACSVVPC